MDITSNWNPKIIIISVIILAIVAIIVYYFWQTKDQYIPKSLDPKILHKKFHKRFIEGISKKKFIAHSKTDLVVYLALYELYVMAKIKKLDPDQSVGEQEYQLALNGL